jgi:hypothetical protein
LWWCVGKVWRQSEGKFIGEDRHAWEAADTFAFKEEEKLNRVEFSKHTVTLHTVPNGNLQRDSRSVDDFDRLPSAIPPLLASPQVVN